MWRGEVLAALAPLYLEQASRRLLPLGIGISDDLDALAETGREAEAGAAILQALTRRDDWDELSLEELAPGAAALLWPTPEAWSAEVAVQSLCPVLGWDPATADMAGLVPARKLRKLRMARHRSARRGAVVELAGKATASDHLECLFRLHAARWASRGEPGVLADASVQAFHRDAVPRLAARGLLHATLLRIEGRVAGVFHGLRRGQAIYAYLGGLDPAFGFESPGTVLMGHALDELMRGGAGTLNLLRGQEPYKYEWGAVDRPNLRRVLRRVPLR